MGSLLCLSHFKGNLSCGSQSCLYIIFYFGKNAIMRTCCRTVGSFLLMQKVWFRVTFCCNTKPPLASVSTLSYFLPDKQLLLRNICLLCLQIQCHSLFLASSIVCFSTYIPLGVPVVSYHLHNLLLQGAVQSQTDWACCSHTILPEVSAHLP